MLDVSGLVPAARPIVQQVAEVYLKHLSPWFVGLIAHGSAVKGGFIPGCSDVDLHLYLDDAALTWHGELPLALGLAVRRDLAGLDMRPFRYVQCAAHGTRLPEGWVGPVPGSYCVVAGRLPVPEATAEDLRASARRDLAALAPPTFVMGELLGPGSERLARNLRLLCTKVWPVLYQALTLQQDDPIAVWGWPKTEAIARLPAGSALSETVLRFHRAVRAYYPAEDSLEGALELIESGAAFLEAAGAWWRETQAWV